ncbi:MAG: hypothetical protein IH949_07385, partial [Bacteroidetes bacterium]|nr:hypothetical protein [Bacteroidota bacterium]
FAIYHLRFLINSFTYIDAIIVDTPIFNESFRARILNRMNIEERLDRAVIFKDYLDKQWNESKLISNYFNWEMYSNELLNDIERIKDKERIKKEE